MPATEVDPSILTPHELSKLNKKDLTRYLSLLQEMYVERGKKYGMSPDDPFGEFEGTHLSTREGQVYHS